MAFLDSIRTYLAGLWGKTMNTVTTTLSTTLIGDGGILKDTTPPALKSVLMMGEAEEAKQRAILDARKFHSGQHDVMLTTRLRQYLTPNGAADATIRLNFIPKLSGSIAARLLVERFDCNEKNETEKANQIDFAQGVWDGSRMKGKRARMLLDTVRDGEYFLLVDFDRDNQRARFTPHPRYTDATLGGDGEGCYLKYPNDDVDQKPLYGVKRWSEQVPQTNGSMKPEPRITIYYDKHIERFAQRGMGWQPAPLPLPDGTELPALEWNTDDGTETGEPLGIPLVHVKTPDLEPAAKEAIPIQRGLDKTYIDMLAASDMEAFRVLVALGWEPSDAAIEPGSWMYTTEENAGVHEITPTDSTRFIQLIDKQIALMSDVTDTPLSLLQRSAQRAAEGTLQEEKESFISRVRDYAETIEMAFEDAFKIARRLHNVYGGLIDGKAVELSEEPAFSVVWQPFTTRTIADKQAETEAMLAAGIPQEVIWRDAWDFDEAKIKGILDKKQNARFGEPKAAPQQPTAAAMMPPNSQMPNGAMPNNQTPMMTNPKGNS